MLYLNEKDVADIGVDWKSSIGIIREAVVCLEEGDFSQPVKPYLRYRDVKNRLIAMPAFVGGNFNASGIKWIASFPDNINKGRPRAHSVVILNDADTGVPIGIINTSLLSVIRTALVSGLVIDCYRKVRPQQSLNVGIIGWGPIGQYHLKMCEGLLGSKIAQAYLFDLRGIDKSTVDFFDNDKITVAPDWETVYRESDIFITCTVSKAPYIDREPKKGSLHLNVSLRDYKVDVLDFFRNTIIVDNWEEVCREKTDIERMYMEGGLKKDDTKSIKDVIIHDCLKDYPEGDPIMFNPMGMAVFDLALGMHYLREADRIKVGKLMD